MMSSYSGATTTTATTNSGPTYVPDQVVVALPYEHLVTGRLADWQAQPDCSGPGDVSTRLGLARLHLQTEGAERFLRRAQPDWVSRADAEAKAAGRPLAPLDLVLSCLRYSFENEYAGWVPSFGKNRVLQRLTGSYVIDATGGRGPRPLEHYTFNGQGQVGEQDCSVKPRGSTPGEGTRIGVLDTVLEAHPYFHGAYIASASSLRSDLGDESNFLSQHATFVTGLLLRQAPGAVVDVRVALHTSPGAEAQNDTWDLAKVIAEMADSKVDVLNLSLGCTTEDAKRSMALTAAVAALGPETLVVAAAGNHATQEPGTSPPPVYPAALDNVVAVGALDGEEQASFSPRAPWVDALAPGADVVSTCASGRDGRPAFATWSGTSFAAAIVSGAVAARTREFGSAPEAWRQMQAKLDRCDGKPVVPLSEVGWP
jgi:membrane-anchored mycosin MYCP